VRVDVDAPSPIRWSIADRERFAEAPMFRPDPPYELRLGAAFVKATRTGTLAFDSLLLQ
jgi:hypothetical protein